MTNRELFHCTMLNENGDELLQLEQCFNVPINNWYEEGLPKHVRPSQLPEITETENLFDHFNTTGWMQSSCNQFCVPAFENKILEKKDGRTIFINSIGNTMIELDEEACRKEDGSFIGSPPHEIDFAIKTKKDYEENRFRYIGNIGERGCKEWVNKVAKSYCEQNDYITTIWAHGPFAFLRDVLGTENAMVIPYEEPDMIKMILKDHLETTMAASEYIIKAIKPDCSFVWEDCCGSSGPFMSPAIFDEVFGWWYKEWKDYLVSMGVRWAVLDTDGNPTPLVRKWYKSGIDCIIPWEVNGVDMLKLAEELPPENIMLGGIYKHMFEPNALSQVGRFNTSDVFEAIEQELERVLKPMKKRGGYIASLDHAANYATSYEAYKYYSNSLLRYGKANVVTRDFKRVIGG